MSRRPRGEMQFGSDSFLDVVANLVGILIILIVIAGLRVSQAPVILPSDDESADSPAAILAENTEEPPIEPEFVSENSSANPAPLAPVTAELTPVNERPSLEPPPEFTKDVKQLSTEIHRLEQGRRVATDQTAAIRQIESELKAQLTRLQGQTTSKERTAQKLANDMATRRANFEQLQETLAQLKRQIEEEAEKSPPVETLEHQVTPISKVVQGHEQHYRLMANRVSEVPIAALTLRVREQIERRKDWLLKQHSHQGVVGPLGGYTMNYVVQRDSLGVLDEVRYGTGVVRISVTNWKIEPTDDLITESAEEALRQGSLFYDSLLTADEGTALTFWVYPDSYELYRKLQKFAHTQGFLVAGRPLPQGIEISGSPNGTRSAGQ